MTNYEEPIDKRTNSQRNKLKSPSKNETRITLRITRENFQDEDSSIILNNKTKKQNKNCFLQQYFSLVKLNCLKSFNQDDFFR